MGDLLTINHYLQRSQAIDQANSHIAYTQFRYTSIDEALALGDSIRINREKPDQWYEHALNSVGAQTKEKTFDVAGWYKQSLEFVCVARYSYPEEKRINPELDKSLLIRPTIVREKGYENPDLSRIDVVRYMTYVCSCYVRDFPCDWLTVKIPFTDQGTYFSVGYRPFKTDFPTVYMRIQPLVLS